MPGSDRASLCRVDIQNAYMAHFVSTWHGKRPKKAKMQPRRQKNAILGHLSVDMAMGRPSNGTESLRLLCAFGAVRLAPYIKGPCPG